MAEQQSTITVKERILTEQQISDLGAAVKRINEREGMEILIVSGNTLAKEAFHFTEYGKSLGFIATLLLSNEVIDRVLGPLCTCDDNEESLA
jgi:riboflavin synthase